MFMKIEKFKQNWKIKDQKSRKKSLLIKKTKKLIKFYQIKILQLLPLRRRKLKEFNVDL